MTGIVWMLPHHGIFLIISIHHNRGIAPVLFVPTYFTMSECCPVINDARDGALTGLPTYACVKTHTFFSHIINIRCTDVGLTITP